MTNENSKINAKGGDNLSLPIGIRQRNHLNIRVNDKNHWVGEQFRSVCFSQGCKPYILTTLQPYRTADSQINLRICRSVASGRRALKWARRRSKDSCGERSQRQASRPSSCSGVVRSDHPQPYSRLCLSTG